MPGDKHDSPRVKPGGCAHNKKDMFQPQKTPSTEILGTICGTKLRAKIHKALIYN